MIKIESVEINGIEAALRGMRNPKNSWDRSDSEACLDGNNNWFTRLGPSDAKLATTLANAGTDHGKFLRFITVSCDIVAPLYWWKEFDTYRMGVEKDSCSTMHKIQEKEFTVEDFSCEHLYNDSMVAQDSIIYMLNKYRAKYLKSKDKDDWWQMIQLLPSSYNQRRTCMMSYAAIRNMYHARKNHKLDEWRNFCEWVESLPHFDEMIK